MIDRISTLRTVANTLISHLCMEGKNIVTKPSAIIPGAALITGAVVTLETKDNNAVLDVQKNNKEIQKACFSYEETPDGYELVSATSSYSYDDEENKEVQKNIYEIKPRYEKVCEQSINYANAPIKETTRTYIDRINSSVAKTAGYQSARTDYDPQESHTYGKKSLQRDLPALLKLLDVIAPNAEFTLKIKDKLKKDNKTSLVAFEASDADNKGIVKGFMAANGDSVSYHIDTDDLIIIGEQSNSKNLSKTYLKPEKSLEQTNDKRDDENNSASTEETSTGDADSKKTRTGRKPKYSLDELKDKIQKYVDDGKTQAEIAELLGFSASYTSKLMKSLGIKPNMKKVAKEEKCSESEDVSDTSGKTAETGNVSNSPVQRNTNHVYAPEYYTEIILKTATDKKIDTKKKVEIYINTAALAYLDGYEKDEIKKILTGKYSKNEKKLNPFSDSCASHYVTRGIKLAETGGINPPARSLKDKIQELQSIKFDIENDALRICFDGMIIELAAMNNNTSEKMIDKALELLKNSSAKNIESNLLSFVQEAAKVNDDLKLQLDIYQEFVKDKKIAEIKSQIEKMINNISGKQYEIKDEFLTKLYALYELKEFEQLKQEVQNFLDTPNSHRKKSDAPKEVKSNVNPFQSLSGSNQKLIIDELLSKRPRKISLTFEKADKLLKDMGFVLSTVNSSHHTYDAPDEIIIGGEIRKTFTVAGKGKALIDKAAINDIINFCKKFYGNKAN